MTGWTALFLAAKAGKLDMFKKLLRHGASTEIQVHYSECIQLSCVIVYPVSDMCTLFRV